jgi:hypothetical protein
MISLGGTRAMAGEIDLRPGDVVKARRLGAFWHFGVYEGYESVVVLLAGLGIARQTLAEFAAGAELRRVDRFTAGRLDHALTLRRAQSMVGMPFEYNLFTKNCEHFARWCATGQAESRQVNGATITAGAALALGFAVAQKPLLVLGAAAVAAVLAIELIATRESARVPVGPVGSAG